MTPPAGSPQVLLTLKEPLVPFAEAVPWPTVVVDESGLVLHLNEPMRLRGIGLESAPDRHVSRMFGDYLSVLNGERPWLEPQDAALTRKVHNLLIQERVWVRRLPKGSCLIITDETRLHELEIAQAQTARLASLGFMLASVSHEVGNPLTAMHSMLQILQSSAQPTPELLQRGLATLAGNVRRLMAITRKLNHFSRVAAEAPVDLCIDQVIDEAAAVFGFDSLGETVELVHHRDPQACLVGQPSELQQVFYNLFLNAAHAMNGQGTITVSVGHTEQLVHVSVLDTGPGIGPEQLQRIFEPFYTTKHKGGGTGLGLTISNEIVLEHGGSIRAEHRPEGGALFHICLPRRPGPAARP
jgi:two-component system NtrC family sensor kinase